MLSGWETSVGEMSCSFSPTHIVRLYFDYDNDVKVSETEDGIEIASLVISQPKDVSSINIGLTKFGVTRGLRFPLVDDRDMAIVY